MGHQWIEVLVMGLALLGSLHAEQWISLDGKVVNGDFVRLEDGVVILRVNDKEYKIPQEKLSLESVDLALTLKKRLVQQADETKDNSIIDEPLLVRLVANAPQKFEGKHFLLSGHVASVSRPSGTSLLSSSREKEKSVVAVNDRVDVTFSSGTKATFDFSKEVAKNVNPTFKHNARIQIEDNSVKLMTLDGFMTNKAKWITKEVLIAHDQNFIMRASVKDGEILCGDQASSQEIRMAQSLQNKKSGPSAPGDGPTRPAPLRKPPPPSNKE